MKNQLTFFNDEKLAKVKYSWSIYAVPRRYDGYPVETIINAYSEKQAKFLFYKKYSDYMITGMYRM